jgi:hypothetical protein
MHFLTYEKVGRLKPDGDYVRIFVDDLGEVDLSESQKGVKITIPAGRSVVCCGCLAGGEHAG